MPYLQRWHHYDMNPLIVSNATKASKLITTQHVHCACHTSLDSQPFNSAPS
jgi:hypothetical protein